ncbi:MAG: leucine-rich repeat domain-containing protein, partial [Prevotella sp.]|nr:leucine-rich repeat domain-containing protein [Prevotella sp.]
EDCTFGDNVFSNCGNSTDNLITLTIGKGVTKVPDGLGELTYLATLIYNAAQCTSITDGVFADCSYLTDLTIDVDVVNIPKTLGDLSKLTTLHYNPSSTSVKFVNYDGSEYVLTESEGSIFKNQANGGDHYYLTTVYIGPSVVALPDYLFCKCEYNITTVTIEEGSALSSIGNSVFYDCFKLESINLPSSISSLGTHIFYNCKALTTVGDNFGSLNLTNKAIPEYTFWNCQVLGSVGETPTIAIPTDVETIGEGAFGYCEAITVITIPSTVTSIGSSAFRDCIELVTVNGLESTIIESISGYVFYNCTKLKSIELPEGVTSIGLNAFMSCTSLENINIPSTVTSIGNQSFDNCTSLKSISIPQNLITIDTRAFYGCSSVDSLYYDDIRNDVRINEDAFTGCSSLEKLTIGEDVQKIMSEFGQLKALVKLYYEAKDAEMPDGYTSSVFADCEKFTTLTIRENVESFDKYTFANCGTLTTVIYKAKSCEISNSPNNTTAPFAGCNAISSITIGDEVTKIPKYLFDAYESGSFANLTSITIPNSVESIEYDAFGYCRHIASVEIPSSVKEIGDFAFYQCNALNPVTFNDGLETIGSGAFEECSSLERVEIPSSVTTISLTAFGDCSKLKYVEIPGNSKDGTTIGGDAFSMYKSTGRPNADDMTLIIGENVKQIGSSAFYNNTNLTTIEYDAAECELIKEDGNSVESEKINGNPDGSPTTDDSPIFEACPNVAEIKIGENVTSIPDYLFSAYDYGDNEGDHRDRETDHFSKLEKLTIPSNVETIGDNAFYGCSGLKELTIEEGVGEIGDQAFYRCNKLTTVYEKRSLEQLRGDYNDVNDYAPDLPTAGDDCFTKYAYEGEDEFDDNCFLVVPEDGARFYTEKVEEQASNDDKGYLGYGAITPTAAGWLSIPHLREDMVTIEMTTAEGYVTHYSPYTYKLAEGLKGG